MQKEWEEQSRLFEDDSFCIITIWLYAYLKSKACQITNGDWTLNIIPEKIMISHP